MDRGTQGSRLPRAKCDLCGEPVVWVEKTKDGKKLPLNPEPVTNHREGVFRRVGNTNKVAFVPDDERWMWSRLYRSHRDTCHPWLQCLADGLRTHAECKQRIGK